MVEKQHAFSLDWLRFTVGDTPTAFSFANAIGATVIEDKHAGNLPFYSDFRLFDFCRIDWHTFKPEMRVCITMSGEHLQAFTGGGGSVHALAAQVLTIENLTVTRIDLALDIHNEINACPKEVYKAHREKRMITHATTSSLVTSRKHGQREGATCYIGSRESPRLLRVYDKAVEQGLKTLWIRVELELKKPLAERALSEVVEYGIIEAFKAEIRGYIQRFDIPWLDDAIVYGVGVLSEPIGRKETDTERWLHETVLPLIEDAIRRGDQLVIFGVKRALERRAQGGHSGA